jgi:YbbR domain-containing protein
VIAPRRPRTLTGLLFDNLPLKAIALVGSVLLFSLVHSDVDAHRSMSIDVVALLPAPDSSMMLVSDVPSEVRITLRGSRSRISALSRDDLQPLQVDLTDTERGYYAFDASDIDLGGGLQVVEISPSTIPLVWAKSKEKQLSVRPQLAGEPRAGNRVREPVEVRPAKVTLRGPEETVAEVSEVLTDVIRVDGLAPGTHTRRVPLLRLPEHVVALEDPLVEVKLVIEPVVTERVLGKLAVEVVGEGSATVRPARVAVTLRGPTNALAELAPEDIVPYVALEGAAGTGVTEEEQVSLRGVPDGIDVTAVVPDTVLVKRRARPNTP